MKSWAPIFVKHAHCAVGLARCPLSSVKSKQKHVLDFRPLMSAARNLLTNYDSYGGVSYVRSYYITSIDFIAGYVLRVKAKPRQDFTEVIIYSKVLDGTRSELYLIIVTVTTYQFCSRKFLAEQLPLSQ